jgi:AcrR family transcriptional regulator
MKEIMSRNEITARRSAPTQGAQLLPKKKLRRAEKSAENRNSLLRAAAKVVGEHGYSEASIARITQEAGLAQGTFYLYFDTRQDILEAVLPFVGKGLSAFIRDRVKGSVTALEVEEKSFRAAFEYLRLNPGFYRTLNEAEFSAPKGFATQYRSTARSYLRSLKRSKKRGELAAYSDRELEVLVYMLMAVRFYLYLRFVKSEGKDGGRLPEWVVKTYLKFIQKALAPPASDKCQFCR